MKAFFMTLIFISISAYSQTEEGFMYPSPADAQDYETDDIWEEGNKRIDIQEEEYPEGMEREEAETEEVLDYGIEPIMGEPQ